MRRHNPAIARVIGAAAGAVRARPPAVPAPQPITVNVNVEAPKARRERVPFVLDMKALAMAGASRVLAIDPLAWGSVMSLAAEPSQTARPPAAAEVAVISIMGPLEQRASEFMCGYGEGYDSIAERFCGACEDPSVGAIVLRFDSPGGDVSGLEECVRQMVAARGTKQVFAYIDEGAHSAAYWIASCVANAGIFLPIAGSVGSIGVIAAVVDESGALEVAGIKVELIRDPPGKAAGNPVQPVLDLARERMIEHVREVSARFQAAVSTARGIPVDAIRALNGDVRRGQAAVDSGLANGLDSLEGVIARAAVAAKPPAKEEPAPAKQAARFVASAKAAPPKSTSERSRAPVPQRRSKTRLRSAANGDTKMADYKALTDAATAASSECKACSAECDKMVELTASGSDDEIATACDALMESCSKADAALDACMQECSAISGTPMPADDDATPDEKAATERDALVAATGKRTFPEALGAISGMKTNVANMATIAKDVKEMKATAEKTEVFALIDAAQRENRVTPATRKKAETFYANHGKAALIAHLEQLHPVAPSKAETVVEPKGSATPAADATAAGGALPPAGAPEGKRYEDMTADQKASLRHSGSAGEAQYQALRSDWEVRTGKVPARRPLRAV